MFTDKRHSAKHTCAKWNSAYAGKDAGCDKCHGYTMVQFYSYRVFAHKIAWLLTYGEWPTREIDHINGNRSDNRIANLRLASASENRCNTPIRRNNKSGIKGVSWCNTQMAWRVVLNRDKRIVFQGYFNDKLAAAEAYRSASLEWHGEFSSFKSRA
jgi:hypothetical protein